MTTYVLRNADNSIAQYGNAPGMPAAGQAVVQLTDAQEAALLALGPSKIIQLVGGAIVGTPADPPPAIDYSTVDGLPKQFIALGLAIAALTGKTPAQVKAAYTTAWKSLP